MKREAIVELDRQHVWRPYTSSEDHQNQDPLVVVSAEGSHLFDADGKKYLDGSGSWWCNNLGHSHPRLRDALKRQMDSFMHCSLAGTTHEPAARLAAELVEVAPKGLTRVFFSDNGSTAVEVSLKMAFQYWQQNGRPNKKRFLALPGAFHGDTIGAMSVSSVDAFSAVFKPLLIDVFRGEVSDPVEWNDVFEQLFAEMRRAKDEIAAIIIEPLVQGAAGMRIWPTELLVELRRVCDETEILLIADEVFTGFGRTGKMWACGHADVTPDILCSAKGLSGGTLPFSATLATDRIYKGFLGDKTRAFMHGHTFCGNPLGASVCLEVLAIYRDEQILDTVAKRSRLLDEAMHRLMKLDAVSQTRSLGMIAAVDLVDANPGYYSQSGWKIAEYAKSQGVHIRPLGNTVYMTPPLTIEHEDLSQLLDVVEQGIAKLP